LRIQQGAHPLQGQDHGVDVVERYSDLRQSGLGIDEYRMPRAVYMAAGTTPEQVPIAAV
jgi:hypothetical protein